MPDPYSGVRVPNAERKSFILSTRDPSPLEDVAQAVSAATESQIQVYRIRCDHTPGSWASSGRSVFHGHGWASLGGDPHLDA